MTDQPDDLGEAYAELQQENLSVVDENSLTANTTTDHERVADEAAGPLTEQPAESSPEGQDGPPPPERSSGSGPSR